MTNRGRTFTLAGALAASGALAIALLTTGPAPPQVSVADVNPGTSVERDLCLSVSTCAWRTPCPPCARWAAPAHPCSCTTASTRAPTPS
ncbi:MAG TPA: hypothetical protein VK420_20755 [Longimicrobium sp.]|nr:hypothetical protein [Longimicrobium sp.]